MKKEKTESMENLNEEREQIVEEEASEVKELTVEDLITKLAELQKRAECAEAKLTAAESKAAEMTEAAQRVQAEFDNYRRRTLENNAKLKTDACVEVISKILPVTDVIAQALSMLTDENVKKGVSMIEDEIMKMLSSYGVTEIEALGCEFDPRLHEAVMQMPAESEEQRDTVKEVFQKGYKMGDKVIRAARVIVNK